MAEMVQDGSARGMIALKGDLGSESLRAAVCELTGTRFPETAEVQASGPQAVLWMAPDELLLLVERPRVGDSVERLREQLRDLHALVEDVSDMRKGYVLDGPEVRDVLARLTPADVSPAALPPGRVRRTRIGQVAAALWLSAEDRAEVMCFASVAEYLRDLLLDAAAGGSLGLHNLARQG